MGSIPCSRGVLWTKHSCKKDPTKITLVSIPSTNGGGSPPTIRSTGGGGSPPTTPSTGGGSPPTTPSTDGGSSPIQPHHRCRPTARLPPRPASVLLFRRNVSSMAARKNSSKEMPPAPPLAMGSPCRGQLFRAQQLAYSLPEDLEKRALEKYAANNGHPFQHLTMWAKLKAEGKWLSCYSKMKGNEEKSSSAGTIDLEGEERPPGRDTAKVERTSKGKSGVYQELGEKLHKFIEVSSQSAGDRQKVIESQLLLSDRQLETAKINSKTKLLDSYTNLLLADTSKMDDFEKAQRAMALKHMQATLFADSGRAFRGRTGFFMEMVYVDGCTLKIIQRSSDMMS
ncbi:hypothetical protein D1007_27952 [Hordeum vulgare]|nr:hypothetical protein D1007_27952 [Hordeum vulgare]